MTNIKQALRYCAARLTPTAQSLTLLSRRSRVESALLTYPLAVLLTILFSAAENHLSRAAAFLLGMPQVSSQWPQSLPADTSIIAGCHLWPTDSRRRSVSRG